MYDPRVILHATDFSPRSVYAFELACSLARETDGELILLHVLPSSDDVVARQKSEDALAQLANSDRAVAMRWAVLAGDPAEKILWLAKEVSCDLIVLAASGRKGLRAMFPRGTLRAIERRAPCPVVRLEVPAACLAEPAAEGSRCVDCGTPRIPAGAGRQSAATQWPAPRHGPVTLIEPHDIFPQI